MGLEWTTAELLKRVQRAEPIPDALQSLDLDP